MVEMTETGVRPAGTRSSAVLVWCAVVGLTALAAAHLFFSTLALPGGIRGYEDTIVYTTFGALAIALLVWHRWPRRSWVVLLVSGALFAAPTHALFLLQPDELPS
jgi:hypothetical protein